MKKNQVDFQIEEPVKTEQDSNIEEKQTTEIVKKENLPEKEPVKDVKETVPEKKAKSKFRTLRNWIIACYYVVCSLFFGVTGYFALSMFLGTISPATADFFGGEVNAITMGIAGVAGIVLYIFIFGIALLPIALGFFYRNSKANYVRILKGANKENMEIMFARVECFMMLIADAVMNILIFFAIIICFTNALLIVGILLSVVLAVAIVFMVLVIVDLVRNRKAYNKLSDEEKEAIKEKIKTFKKNKVKKERRKRAGKLY